MHSLGSAPDPNLGKGILPIIKLYIFALDLSILLGKYKEYHFNILFYEEIFFSFLIITEGTTHTLVACNKKYEWLVKFILI